MHLPLQEHAVGSAAIISHHAAMTVLAYASMALAQSAHAPRVQLSVHDVNACWHSEVGQHMPSRYLAMAGTPVIYYYSAALTNRHMVQTPVIISWWI